MDQVPRTDAELLELLRERHRNVMEGRPEQGPGTWKTRPNRAGATVFVQPPHVEGTLRAGFEVGRRVIGALARATYMMFLVTEVHPFADGNGRVSRLLMNSELVAAGEVRIIIPTVYRNNYLAALRGVSHDANHAGLYATLEFARRYTARIDFSRRESAEADLSRTNALLDPNVADANGIRLMMP
jgi:Fic family protein